MFTKKQLSIIKDCLHHTLGHSIKDSKNTDKDGYFTQKSQDVLLDLIYSYSNSIDHINNKKGAK